MRHVRILNLFISSILPSQPRQSSKTVTACINCGRFQLTPRILSSIPSFQQYSTKANNDNKKTTSNGLKYSKLHKNARPAEPSIAITKLATQGRSSEALAIYLQLLKDGGFPSRESLYQLTRSMYRSSNLLGMFTIHDTLLSYYSKQTISNKSSRAMTYMYTMLIHLITKNTKPIDMDTIRFLLKEMTQFISTTNVVLYNILIKALLEQHMTDQAHAMYDDLLKNKIEPTIKTFNILMKDASKRKDVGRLMGYLDKMNQCPTVNIDYGIVNIIVTTLCDLKEFDKAIDLVERINLPYVKDELISPKYRLQLLRLIESKRKGAVQKRRKRKKKELNSNHQAKHI